MEVNKPDEVVVQNLTAHFSAPLFDAKDVLHTGSRIGVSALDEVMFRGPVRENRCNQRTGRDSNPLDLTVVFHVLQTDSRACIES